MVAPLALALALALAAGNPRLTDLASSCLMQKQRARVAKCRCMCG